jgi:hypothetical protein
MVFLGALILSCSFLSDKKEDITYYTPKFLPSGEKIVLLKNIHKYKENGGAGGVNEDDILSDWYLVSYDVKTGSVTESVITGLGFDPFWMKKGITSVTDSFASIVTDFSALVLTLQNTRLDSLNTGGTEVLDVGLDQGSRFAIVLANDVLTFSLLSIDINTKESMEVIKFSSYYPNLLVPNSNESNLYFLYDSNTLSIVNAASGTFHGFSSSIMYAASYDSNKVAFLRPDGYVVFNTFTPDTLIQNDSLKLEHANPVNFSVGNLLAQIVYQTREGPGPTEIVLRDVASKTERVLFSNTHKKL